MFLVKMLLRPIVSTAADNVYEYGEEKVRVTKGPRCVIKKSRGSAHQAAIRVFCYGQTSTKSIRRCSAMISTNKFVFSPTEMDSKIWNKMNKKKKEGGLLLRSNYKTNSHCHFVINIHHSKDKQKRKRNVCASSSERPPIVTG